MGKAYSILLAGLICIAIAVLQMWRNDISLAELEMAVLDPSTLEHVPRPPRHIERTLDGEQPLQMLLNDGDTLTISPAIPWDQWTVCDSAFVTMTVNGVTQPDRMDSEHRRNTASLRFQRTIKGVSGSVEVSLDIKGGIRNYTEYGTETFYPDDQSKCSGQ
jgi:hypothetical protein